MRRLTPYVLLAAVGLLALAAAVAGSESSQDVSYYSLPVGSPLAQQALDRDIRATLSAPSYTFHSGTTVIQYVAPHRARALVGSDVIQIQIGSHWYLRLSDPGQAATWQEMRALRTNRLSVLSFPKRELQTLLSLTSVQRNGDTFTAYRVIPASLVSTSTGSGQYLLTYTIVVRSGYVASETYIPSGSPSLVVPTCHHPQTIFSCFRIPTSTFSAFGTTPPIDPPPSNEVVVRPSRS
jgi:hypothetical protein